MRVCALTIEGYGYEGYGYRLRFEESVQTEIITDMVELQHIDYVLQAFQGFS